MSTKLPLFSSARVCSLLLFAALAGGCSARSEGLDAERPHPDDADGDAGIASARDSAEAEVEAGAGDASPLFAPCPGALASGPNGHAGADLIREGSAGSIDVAVAFCNPLIPRPLDELLFFVSLTDHLGLAPSDIMKGTSVTTGADTRTDGPFGWDGDDLTVDDHHAKGHLHAPARTGDGTPLLAPDTTYLELRLGGIGGDGAITARWEQDYLP